MEQSMFSDDDERRIQEIFNETLDRKRTMDLETHRRHHIFIDTMIEQQNVKAQRHEALLRSVMGWGIIVFLSGIGTAVYNFFLKNGGN